MTPRKNVFPMLSQVILRSGASLRALEVASLLLGGVLGCACELNTYGVSGGISVTDSSGTSTTSEGRTPTTQAAETQSATSDTTGAGSASTGDGAVCGNGIPEEAEVCDDGNKVENDGCEELCTHSGIERVYAGSDVSHTCVQLKSSRYIKCWGYNEGGQLGYKSHGTDDNIGDDEEPSTQPSAALPASVDAISHVEALALGRQQSCALVAKKVYCWGSNEEGYLGYGHKEVRVLLPAVLENVDLQGEVHQIAGAELHTCALLEGGAVRCWGYNGQGQLGLGDPASIGTVVGDEEKPSKFDPVNLGEGVTALQVAVGVRFTCVLTDGETVLCWGFGDYGQLGDGITTEHDAVVPGAPIDGLDDVKMIALGSSHACAVTSDGLVKCWGSNVRGQVGVKKVESVPSPVTVQLGEVSVERVFCGAQHTCILSTDGDAYCWGFGAVGQLGSGHKGDVVVDGPLNPVAVTDNGKTKVIDLALGRHHTCALLEDGRLRCWGLAESGQLGYGNPNNIENPNNIGDEPMEMPPPDVHW